jgi:hypothetical protein
VRAECNRVSFPFKLPKGETRPNIPPQIGLRLEDESMFVSIDLQEIIGRFNSVL